MNAIAINPFGLTNKNLVIKGMDAEWIIPECPAPPKVILFARINEVLVNQPKASDTLISFAVINTGIPALRISYHYNLKECFAGALENFKEAYEWLLCEGYEPKDIIIACDSPGGCLTVGLLAFLQENRIPMPMGGLQCYPEDSASCPSYRESGINFLEINSLKYNY